HGMQPEERLRIYREMARVTSHKVIIHDFNKKRGLLTTILEKMEGGDYFRFIHVAEDEMRACGAGEGKCFDNVEVFPVATRVSWYVCTPE
ncbi:MAG TPA: class I SAM-dependent methyltransferase, partial [Candidatus Limnocylindria bacterium]|nr:class I SAM-dependent methyltransferase [Candidatus Limnocylindria bacterium]